MPVCVREDLFALKAEPGAYVSLGGELYCVDRFERTGPRSGMLWVVNCRDERPVRLTVQESRDCCLVRAGVSPLG